MSVEVLLDIACEDWRITLPDVDSVVQETLNDAVSATSADLAEYPGRVEIGVLLADDAALQALNRDYRGIDKPTNVLSFPISRTLPADFDMPVLLGDLAIAWQTVAAEAERDGKSLAHHLRHMLVHGVLHLLGFDHETEAEAETMERLEAQILLPFGVSNPYLIDIN